MKVKSENEVAHSYLTLHSPMDCSPLGSSVHGIFPGKSTGVGCHFLLHTISWSLLKLMSIDLVMPSGHYILLPAPAPLGGSFPLALSHHAVLSGCKMFHLLCYHLPPMPSYPAMSQAHLSTNVCCGCAQSPVMPDSLRPHGLQCSPLSSFVHGILQAAILEWVAIFSSRGSS